MLILSGGLLTRFGCWWCGLLVLLLLSKILLLWRWGSLFSILGLGWLGAVSGSSLISILLLWRWWKLLAFLWLGWFLSIISRGGLISLLRRRGRWLLTLSCGLMSEIVCLFSWRRGELLAILGLGRLLGIIRGSCLIFLLRVLRWWKLVLSG